MTAGTGDEVGGSGGSDGSGKAVASIPTVFVTMQDSDVIYSYPALATEVGRGGGAVGQDAALYTRYRPWVNWSSILIWALGVATTAYASWAAGEDLRRKHNAKRAAATNSAMANAKSNVGHGVGKDPMDGGGSGVGVPGAIDQLFFGGFDRTGSPSSVYTHDGCKVNHSGAHGSPHGGRGSNRGGDDDDADDDDALELTLPHAFGFIVVASTCTFGSILCRFIPLRDSALLRKRGLVGSHCPRQAIFAGNPWAATQHAHPLLPPLWRGGRLQRRWHCLRTLSGCGRVLVYRTQQLALGVRAAGQFRNVPLCGVFECDTALEYQGRNNSLVHGLSVRHFFRLHIAVLLPRKHHGESCHWKSRTYGYASPLSSSSSFPYFSSPWASEIYPRVFARCTVFLFFAQCSRQQTLTSARNTPAPRGAKAASFQCFCSCPV